LPSPAYTEQYGMYENLEGRIQECRKANYPTGEAKEGWKIFNLISNKLFDKNLFKDHFSIKTEVLKNIPNFSNIDFLPNKIIKPNVKLKTEFENEKIKIKEIDYYYTNAISRASKTMAECRSIKYKELKNGTNN
jgi:NADH-quinone oxidoreductase subunit G